MGVLNVALAKARRAWSLLAPLPSATVVVAADTAVVTVDRVLGKPDSPDAARAMLSELRGRPHAVISGLVLQTGDARSWGASVSTTVHMRAYDDQEIGAYIARGEPFDKAGGYAIQDSTFRPVERLAGCYLNVVGLPLCAVAAGLTALGVDLSDHGSAGPPPCDWCRAGAPLVAIDGSL